MKEIQGWRGALTNQEPAWEARCLAVKETEITHVGRKETQEMCEGQRKMLPTASVIKYKKKY